MRGLGGGNINRGETVLEPIQLSNYSRHEYTLVTFTMRFEVREQVPVITAPTKKWITFSRRCWVCCYSSVSGSKKGPIKRKHEIVF